MPIFLLRAQKRQGFASCKVDSLFQNVQKWVNRYEDNKDKIDKVINTLKK